MARTYARTEGNVGDSDAVKTIIVNWFDVTKQARSKIAVLIDAIREAGSVSYPVAVIAPLISKNGFVY